MKHTTELVFILDRSGSMSGLETDTIGGFNSMIAKQKREAGEALVSTVLFDNESVVIHDRLPLEDVPPMTEKEYFTLAARRCWMPWAEPSTTSATSTSTPAAKMYRKRRCSLSPPTVTKMPAAVMTMRRCGA